QLLKDDRSSQRLEVSSVRADSDAARTDRFNYAREDRVDPLEMSDRGAVVGHRENLRERSTARCDALAPAERYRATFRMSATNIRSARTRSSLGARNTDDG